MAKILVVEDNQLNLKLFCDLLSLKKHEILTSNDGVNVEEIVLHNKPDLILMDIQLSGISGIDLIKAIKANNAVCSIPIIAITAFAMKQDASRIMESGCDMYLSKPVSIDDFFKAIDSFLNINNKSIA